jgi:5-methylcytosine-specific restriction enzyme subunit McrC
VAIPKTMMVRRLRLAEFRTQRAIALSAEERDALRRLHPGIRIEPTLGATDLYDLTADQRVGVISLPSVVIEVRPKVPMSSVLFLVSYACDAAFLFSDRPEFAENDNLADIIAIMLARLVVHATRRGLLNGYRTEDESLQAPRGRVLFDEQNRRRFGISPPIEVRHDVFTPDILENRLLLSALRGMNSTGRRSDRAKRELFRAQGLLGGVSMQHFRPSTIPEVVFTRLNQHYLPAISLAALVLRSASLDIGQNGPRGSAFLIDMNVVFERFVRTALRATMGVDNASFPERAPATFLDQAAVVPLKPDLCLVENQKITWIGDAKYKRLPSGAYTNADLYQLLAYAVALNLTGGTLIYAADEGVRRTEHVVLEAGKRLRVEALDLTAPPSAILRQVQEVAQRSGLMRAQTVSLKTAATA